MIPLKIVVPQWKSGRPACHGQDPEVWQQPAAEPTAKRICAECPIKAECLDYAVRNGETSGVWGGLNATELQSVRRELRRRSRAAVRRTS